MPISYEDNVFINCPFDDPYETLFKSIVFVVYDAGFIARSALEESDSGQVRFDKIMHIISECKYGIHDISRTDLDSANSLPRFNMPLELGIFLGCKRFGAPRHRSKVCLIMDIDKYRYQKFISDIAGQDIVEHGNSPEKVMREIRGWLRTESKRTNIPGGAKIYERYSLFEKDLPDICRKLNVEIKELTFVDFSHIVTEWLKANPLYGSTNLSRNR
jgi:hypothetical protein